MADNVVKRPVKKNCRAAIFREIGLEQYEGDEKIYADVLEHFAKSNKCVLMRLNTAIDTGDLTLAFRIAHSLRGAAGAIGAARLASTAFSIESTLSPMNGSWSDFAADKAFNEQMVLLEKEFSMVFDELKVSIIEKEEESLCCGGVMDREKTIELVDELAPLLETGDTKCLEYLDRIEEVFLPASEAFKLFITKMESYDFEQAYEIMKNIRQFMIP